MRTPIVSHLLALAWRRRLAVMLLSGAAGAAVACPPSPGATCDSGDEAPASQPLGVGVNLDAGNPINVINGNKYQREEDLPALPGVVTSAIFTDTIVKDLLMGIFKDFDKFTVMGHALMRKNLDAAVKYDATASETYIAAMVARAHRPT